MVTGLFSVAGALVICTGLFLSWFNREVNSFWIILLGSIFGLPACMFILKNIFGASEIQTAIISFFCLIVFVASVRLTQKIMNKGV